MSSNSQNPYLLFDSDNTRKMSLHQTCIVLETYECPLLQRQVGFLRRRLQRRGGFVRNFGDLDTKSLPSKITDPKWTKYYMTVTASTSTPTILAEMGFTYITEYKLRSFMNFANFLNHSIGQLPNPEITSMLPYHIYDDPEVFVTYVRNNGLLRGVLHEIYQSQLGACEAAPTWIIRDFMTKLYELDNASAQLLEHSSRKHAASPCSPTSDHAKPRITSDEAATEDTGSDMEQTPTTPEEGSSDASQDSDWSSGTSSDVGTSPQEAVSDNDMADEPSPSAPAETSLTTDDVSRCSEWTRHTWNEFETLLNEAIRENEDSNKVSPLHSQQAIAGPSDQAKQPLVTSPPSPYSENQETNHTRSPAASGSGWSPREHPGVIDSPLTQVQTPDTGYSMVAMQQVHNEGSSGVEDLQEHQNLEYEEDMEDMRSMEDIIEEAEVDLFYL